MIALPPQFDLTLWFTQISQIVLPFVPISLSFTSYFLIKKIARSL